MYKAIFQFTEGNSKVRKEFAGVTGRDVLERFGFWLQRNMPDLHNNPERIATGRLSEKVEGEFVLLFGKI